MSSFVTSKFLYTGKINFISKDDIELLKSFPLQRSDFGQSEQQRDETRNSHEYVFDNHHPRLKEINSEFYNICANTLKLRVINHFNTKFIVYTEGSFFKKHVDFGSVSLVVQLDRPDSYDGGDLVFEIDDKPVFAKKERFRYYLFNSKIPHWVTLINKGYRSILSYRLR